MLTDVLVNRYFPLGFAILGWPWVAVQMLDGHI